MNQDTALVLLDQARTALAECRDAMEAKQLADAAEAARVYLERTNASVELVNKATEVRLLAERQMGEFLAAMPKATGVRLAGRDEDGSSVVTEGNRRENAPTLAEMGIRKKESARAQKLAALPKDEFEERLKLAQANGEKLTVAKVLSTPPPRPGSTPPPRPRPVDVDTRTFGEVCADALFVERERLNREGNAMGKADVARVIDSELAKWKPGAAAPAAPPTDLVEFEEARAAICDFRRYSEKPWRKASTKWSPKEAKALKALCPIPREDLATVAAYYSAQDIAERDDYRRRDLQTLLNNWAGELDRARGWMAKHREKAAPKPRDNTRI